MTIEINLWHHSDYCVTLIAIFLKSGASLMLSYFPTLNLGIVKHYMKMFPNFFIKISKKSSRIQIQSTMKFIFSETDIVVGSSGQSKALAEIFVKL